MERRGTTQAFRVLKGLGVFEGVEGLLNQFCLSRSLDAFLSS